MVFNLHTLEKKTVGFHTERSIFYWAYGIWNHFSSFCISVAVCLPVIHLLHSTLVHSDLFLNVSCILFINNKYPHTFSLSLISDGSCNTQNPSPKSMLPWVLGCTNCGVFQKFNQVTVFYTSLSHKVITLWFYEMSYHVVWYMGTNIFKGAATFILQRNSRFLSNVDTCETHCMWSCPRSQSVIIINTIVTTSSLAGRINSIWC